MLRANKTFKEISNYSMLCTICALFTSFPDISTHLQQLPVQYYSYHSNLNVVREHWHWKKWESTSQTATKATVTQTKTATDCIYVKEKYLYISVNV